jgi:hypothetical protein
LTHELKLFFLFEKRKVGGLVTVERGRQRNDLFFPQRSLLDMGCGVRFTGTGKGTGTGTMEQAELAKEDSGTLDSQPGIKVRGVQTEGIEHTEEGRSGPSEQC